MPAATQKGSASPAVEVGMRDLGGDGHGWRAGGCRQWAPTMCSGPAAFVAEGLGQPLPPCMEMMDGIGLAAATLGFPGRGCG